MAAERDDLEEYRRLGRLEAEAFDRGLREREHQAWQELLVGLSSGAEDENYTWSYRREDTPEIWRLQREVERLAAFHEAVLGSRAWRLIQALRRPFGRAW